MPKLQISIRISETGKRILDAVTEETGGTQAAAIELALRQYAKNQGLKIPEKKEPEKE